MQLSGIVAEAYLQRIVNSSTSGERGHPGARPLKPAQRRVS
jgi:hypothetical protein